MTLRNCFLASSILPAHWCRAIWPFRRHLTFAEWSWQISIVDSIGFRKCSVQASVGRREETRDGEHLGRSLTKRAGAWMEGGELTGEVLERRLGV